jgi:adenine-specific DNA methylase
MQAKKLIEVALPIKEISAESVRDKSIRHGHISTLHLWWARRPLPACRAIIFSSLIPDPLDDNCPEQFKEAVSYLLGNESNFGDPYKPYEDIPYTAAIDLMDDNLRNRLMMFIGKYSDEYCKNELKGKVTASLNVLDNNSLIKWDNKNNEEIINKARKLIWVSHNSSSALSLKELLSDFDKCYNDIKTSENELYTLPDRHIKSKLVSEKELKLKVAIEEFQNKMPKVFDPFAGGGALPLEAARLGCKSYGNDINPVAHIIQKGGLEYPQKFGKQLILSKNEFILKYGENEFNKTDNSNYIIENGEPRYVVIKNRLSFDIEYYANKIITSTYNEIGKFYPKNNNNETPIAYYWARVGRCSNLSCKAELPLLRGFYLVNTPTKQIYLNPR